MNLNYLLKNESYHLAALLTANEFINLCKSCDLPANSDLFEFFEQKKWFFPFARIRYPWDSPFTKGWTKVFRWEGKQPLEWCDRGILWAPENRRFLSWKHFELKNGDTKYESFYSRFQIYQYYKLFSLSNYSINVKTLLSSYNKAFDAFKKSRINLKKASEILFINRANLQRICWLCQCLSDRYYPQTQTNLRKIRLIKRDFRFNWHEYRRKWAAQIEIDKLGIQIADLVNFQRDLTGILSSIDPLYQWHDLIAFVDSDKKSHLSGLAQLAQQFYAMEMMIRLFYEDLTDKQLPAPYYDNLTDSPYNHGIKNEYSSLPFLRYIANRYSVNPQPKLIFICEGRSEVILYSVVIKDIFGRSPEVLGISFMDIGGVGNAIGSKKYDQNMALKHLIDYQHHLMTIVFVALDNEGNAKRMLHEICNKKSIWDSDRMVTCKEYIKIWNPSLEYANFSHKELALALNRVTKSQNLFEENDVDSSSKMKGDSLTELFMKKTKENLLKPDLAKELAGILVEQCKKDENPYQSEIPILMTIRRIIWMCSWHTFPNSKVEEDRNRNFWFGNDSKIRDERYHDWINEPLIMESIDPNHPRNAPE